MRLGFIISFALHALLLGALMIEWPFFGPQDEVARGVQATPIEITTLSDIANARAQAPPEPEDEMLETEQEAEVVPASTERPAPAPTPGPQPLDLGGLAGKLKGSQPSTASAQSGPPRPQAGDGSAESQTIESRVASLMRRHMIRCWRSPIDATDPERLTVVLQFRLDPRGRLDGSPRVLRPRSVAGDPELRTAVERAVRAARDCSPYPFPDDALVGEHYDFWRENIYRFTVEQ